MLAIFIKDFFDQLILPVVKLALVMALLLTPFAGIALVEKFVGSVGGLHASEVSAEGSSEDDDWKSPAGYWGACK
jgi:hypothetical protein